MPKETFYNLPEKKRQLIEKMAISEFAEFGYDKASITRIVEGCNIAKGSFYQYFDDKKDLFLYLINRVGEEKVKAISPVMERSQDYDFFGLIRELFLEGLKFAADNPELTMMGDWLFKNRSHPIYDEIVGAGMENAANIYAGLLKEAIKKGEVRADIDLDFVSHAISSLSVSSVEYYFQTGRAGKASMRKFDNRMIGIIEILMDLLKNGIGTQNKGGSDND